MARQGAKDEYAGIAPSLIGVDLMARQGAKDEYAGFILLLVGAYLMARQGAKGKCCSENLYRLTGSNACITISGYSNWYLYS